MGQPNIAHGGVQFSEYDRSNPLYSFVEAIEKLEPEAFGEIQVSERNSLRRRAAPLQARAEIRGGAGPSNTKREGLRRPKRFFKALEETSRKFNIAPPRLKVLMQTPLSESDLKPYQNRLVICKTKILNNFLTSEEEKRLKLHKEPQKVIILSPGVSENLNLTWRPSARNYALNGKWNDFRNQIDLKVGTVIQLWFFRLGPVLCIRLVKKGMPSPASA